MRPPAGNAIKFDLTAGLAIAVVVLALLLGFSLGHNSRPGDNEAQAAKRTAYAAAVPRGRAAAKGDAFNAGLSAGMIKGARVGKKRGQAAAFSGGATAATGATSATSATGSTDSSGATGASGKTP